ncbi:MAG: cell division protein ZapA [Ferrimonas sp.]
MSHNTPDTIDITVLGRKYTIACPLEKRAELQGITAELNSRLQALKKRTGSTSMEHMMVMVTLNLLREQMEAKSAHAHLQGQLHERLKSLEVTIDQRLSDRHTNPKKAVEPDEEAS